MQFKIIETGDASGNGMVVKFRLPSGLEIFGLPTKNHYGGHWDLGPTWNYAVMTDEPFLVDCGRYGQGRHLLRMMTAAGIRPSDLRYVLISHSHEDHDGGLAELVDATCLNIRAHRIYDLLIRRYPEAAPQGPKGRFPAKCWHCFMPESFVSENCLDYHRVLVGLEINSIPDGINEIGRDVHTHHLPGHSPDSIAVQLGEEAIVVGDVILPDITPWPTRIELFDQVAQVLRPHYMQPGEIFGLLRYLRSLHHLQALSGNHPDMAVLPAHRLLYRNQWRTIALKRRLAELIDHHARRCEDILNILSRGPKSADEIAGEHFDAGLLKGFGRLMAANEIISHCELMAASGDVEEISRHRYAATGTAEFEKLIRA